MRYMAGVLNCSPWPLSNLLMVRLVMVVAFVPTVVVILPKGGCRGRNPMVLLVRQSVATLGCGLFASWFYKVCLSVNWAFPKEGRVLKGSRDHFAV